MWGRLLMCRMHECRERMDAQERPFADVKVKRFLWRSKEKYLAQLGETKTLG